MISEEPNIVEPADVEYAFVALTVPASAGLDQYQLRDELEYRASQGWELAGIFMRKQDDPDWQHHTLILKRPTKTVREIVKEELAGLAGRALAKMEDQSGEPPVK